MNLYDTSALFNQNMSDKQQAKFRDFYRVVFGEYNITTIHDCSIGAGGSTLPLADLGYRVSGSDLSDNLLSKAREKFEARGHVIDLFNCDFRQLAEVLPGTYDCVISTGNSLPHISNSDVATFIKAVSSKLNEGGLLFIDMRNWDNILKERPIFSARDPFVMTEEKHVSLYQIWNWHDDGSVDFIFVTSTDIRGKHEKTSYTFAPTYYPLRYRDYVQMLTEHGFVVKQCYDVDHLWLGSLKEGTLTGAFETDFDQVGWYGILAQKVR